MYAPFAKHPFHETHIGNLIDSAMLIACGGVAALWVENFLMSSNVDAHVLNTP